MTQSPPVVRYLRAALGPDADGPSDADLLGRFVAERDQGAFELLVWRHAGALLRTCRAVLRDHHAAEDVTQAAFLALARKAGSIHRRHAVAGWLYRVAYRLAVRVAARRAGQPPALTAELDQFPAPVGSPADPDAVRLLHEELARLPEKYRAPVLLCFFDGLSHADAARRLGWPVGTVAGRVARAKEQLRRRLAARGIAVPAVGAAVLAEPAFVATAAQAAAAFAAGPGAVPGVSNTVLELAKGAIGTMSTTKLQWAAGLLAACGALTVGGVWAGQQPAAGPAPAGQPPAAEKPAAGQPKADKAEPAGRKATATQRLKSLNNLRQIVLAMHNYDAAYGRLPTDVRDKDGKPLLSWRVAILPFIEQQNLYQEFKLDEPWDSPHNKKLMEDHVPKLYHTGTEKGAADTYYQVFAGPGTAFDPKRVERVPGAQPGFYFRSKWSLPAIPDGTANTFGVVEAGPPVPWAKPADIPYDPKKPLPKLEGPFANVLNVATLDGSAYALKRDIDAGTFRHLIEAADGNPLPDFKKLQAATPAETPEEKAALKQAIERNEALIGEVERLLKEHVALLGAQNRRLRDLTQTDEQEKHLERLVEELKVRNKQLRDDLGLKGGNPVPK